MKSHMLDQNELDEKHVSNKKIRKSVQMGSIEKDVLVDFFCSFIISI